MHTGEIDLLGIQGGDEPQESLEGGCSQLGERAEHPAPEFRGESKAHLGVGGSISIAFAETMPMRSMAISMDRSIRY